MRQAAVSVCSPFHSARPRQCRFDQPHPVKSSKTKINQSIAGVRALKMKKESPFPAKGMGLVKTAAILSLGEKHCKEVNSQCCFLEKYMENSALSLVRR